MDKAELSSIVQEYGTPCYLFDTDELAARIAGCREILQDRIPLCYSIKANPFLVPRMAKEVPLLEVCSPGEFLICKQCGVPAGAILLSGVNKTEEDIKEALAYGVRLFTAESVLHAFLLQKCAADMGIHDLPVLLRLTAGSQFGMDEKDLLSLIEHAEDYPSLYFYGIHYFSGTQRKKLTSQQKELDRLTAFCHMLEKEKHFSIKHLEYGTGLYYPYFENEDFSDTLSPLRELAPTLFSVAEQFPLTIEMGRFFASSCGTFLTRVMDTKINCDQGYAILDGGIHHLNYYGGNMGMRKPVITHLPSTDQTEPREWMLCGSLCTTADILVRGMTLSGLAAGDILAFHHCGAYSVTEAPALFLSRRLPAIVLKENGNLHLARSAQESAFLNCPMN